MAQPANKPSGQSGIQVQQPSLPKGGGASTGLGETFASNEFTGTSSLTIPIPATPCRGFEPALHLSYSSGNGQSPFGLGWELSLPEIARQTSKGIPRYDDRDTFLFTGDDYLVPTLDATGQPVVTRQSIGAVTYQVQRYQPRTEANFELIERYTTPQNLSDVFWKVTDKDNVISIFGKGETAKIYDPSDSTRIFKWLLEETYDAKGNHEIYEYQKENSSGIAETGSEINRDKQTNTYLTRIRYGNDQPITDGSVITGASQTPLQDILWHFDIVFDYGAYNIDPSNPSPDTIPEGQTWSLRKDPFSSYSAGFEIRTYRLCQNILLFHRFEEIGSNGPALTRVLRLGYKESSLLTLLTSAELAGYQFTPDSPYQTKSLPALEFDYTPFEPAEPNYTPHGYERFTGPDGQPLPQVANSPAYQLVDLYGAGLPGVLYADGETVRYWEPQQVAAEAVRYEGGKDIPFPISRRAGDVAHTLTDVTGNGKLDLLVSAPHQAGYYEAHADGSWQPFTAFESFPSDYHQPRNSQADVTGDGLADIVLIEDDAVRVYPSERQKGYGNPLMHARENEVPASKADAATQALRFADMIGSGQPQRVHIANGRVECWPSLGYGQFGKPVVMDHVPDFGEDFDAARLLLSDIDGSGTTDLIYISPNHIDLYLNQSGNSFATTPIRIPLPASWDRLDQLQFADVRGNGTSCLVFTQTHLDPQQWFYDFNQAQKPHLLREMNNNMGARTQINYTGSPQFHLADKAQGRPWITPLPFPVNVVASITHYDDVSKTSTVSSYQYHHGYYDGFEREFRGFGRVDRTDTSSFADFSAPGSPEDAAYSPPPVLIKTWYHTGAYIEEEDLLAQYRKEYWQGDQDAHTLPATVFEYIDTNADAEAVRGAHRTLHGSVLRSEVYGRDDTPWQDQPYSVSETQFKVKQLQKQHHNKYNVFLLHSQESMTYDYERNPADPRIRHEFTLEIDGYGHVLKSCSVDYGRRQAHIPAGMDPQTKEQQQKTWISYEENSYISNPHLPNPEFYLLGVALESKTYQIEGISSKSGHYFTFDDLKDQIATALATPPAVGQAKLWHWERDYYYDAQQQKELPLGQVTAQKLHHRTEFIEFEKSVLERPEAFGFLQENDPNSLRDLLTGDGTTFHGAKGGYITFSTEEENQYYWNPGSAQSYDANGFFLPNAYFDPFQYAYINYAAAVADSNKAAKTSYTYDRYYLLETKVVDPLNNQTQVTKIDYRTLHAAEMQDLNGNMTSVLVDPLGLVIASSQSGTQTGGTVAFADLSTYQPVANPSLKEMMSEPVKYLQGAASFYYYDLHAWREKAEPVYTVTLHDEDYTSVNGTERTTPPGIQKTIRYSDGFGRQLQSKVFFDGAQTVRHYDEQTRTVEEKQANPCWLTSGATRYNHKGAPIQQYEPFFSESYPYIPQDDLNQVGYSATLYYDALDREVLVRSPEGFITKTLFGTLNDQTDSVSFRGYLNQKLYQNLGSMPFQPSAWSSLHYDTNDALGDSDYTPAATADVDQDAYDKAKKFLNTPFEHIEDSMGRTVQSEQLNVSELEKNATFVTFDILGDELTSRDQRLNAEGKWNFQTLYNLSREAIQVISADAGTKWTLANALGHPIYSKDSRNFELFYSYDTLHRPVQTYVQGGDEQPVLAQIVERVVYGDSQDTTGTAYFQSPETRNLRGQAVIHLDQAGLSLAPFFTINAQALRSEQWLKTDYQHEANWNTLTQQDWQAMAAAISGNQPAVDFHALPTSLQSLLEPEVFITKAQYDAIGRVKESTDADGNTHTPGYYTTNWLKSMVLTAGAKANHAAAGPRAHAPNLSDITYNAKGQRTSVTYGNRVRTIYTYDQKNFRLTGIKSTRGDAAVVQDMAYHHDPEGNVSSVTNNAIPSVFFNNQQVNAKADYAYDALYHLIKATGREHAAMWQNAQRHHNKFNEAFFNTLGTQLSDGQALQNYTQHFTYDGSGNLTQMRHSGDVATRKTVIEKDSNRIDTSSFGAQTVTPVKYEYDANGNMKTLAGTAGIAWNYRDNMQSVNLIARANERPDAEYYVYDGSGDRVRKVWEQKTAGGTRIHEVIYLGGIEIRRSKTQVSNEIVATVAEEWHTVRVMDQANCVCVWRYWQTGEMKAGAKKNQLCYQLNDLLNSSNYELDEEAQLITYEEYYPYGGTSIIAARNQIDVKTKHYHYSGKEKERSSGLYYYGMRYYSPWLGRWTSTDPAGTVDGLNLYAFVHANPVTSVDVEGMMDKKKKTGRTNKGGFGKKGGGKGKGRGKGREKPAGGEAAQVKEAALDDSSEEEEEGWVGSLDTPETEEDRRFYRQADARSEEVRAHDSLARLLHVDGEVVTAVAFVETRTGEIRMLMATNKRYKEEKKPESEQEQEDREQYREKVRTRLSVIRAYVRGEITVGRAARQLRTGRRSDKPGRVMRDLKRVKDKRKHGAVGLLFVPGTSVVILNASYMNVHAEDTIRVAVEAAGGSAEGLIIGVSKLCCSFCFGKMVKSGVIVRGTHGWKMGGRTFKGNSLHVARGNKIRKKYHRASDSEDSLEE